MTEGFAYVKEVDCSAPDFPVHASVHKVVFNNFIYLEKKPPHKLTHLQFKTIPEAYIFE